MLTDEKKTCAAERKKYDSPRLIRYGTVEEITQSGGSTQPDAHQSQQHHPGQGGGPGDG
jgi:hypothetical protein